MKNILSFDSHFERINEQQENKWEFFFQILENPMEAPMLEYPARYISVAEEIIREAQKEGYPITTQDFVNILKYFGREEIPDPNAPYQVYRVFTDSFYENFAFDKKTVDVIGSKLTPTEKLKLEIAAEALAMRAK